MTTEPEKQPGHWIVEVFSDGTRHASQFETEEVANENYESLIEHGRTELWKDGSLVKKNY